MKKIILLILFVSTGLFTANAQDTIITNRINISVGIGYSPGFLGQLPFPAATNSYYTASYEVQNRIGYGTSFTSNVPHLDFFTDYRISRAFSVGLAASYENENVTQSWGQSNSTINATDFVTRTNLASRLLYHIKMQKPHVSETYLGLRVGASYWTDVCTLSPGVNPKTSIITSFLTPTTQLNPSVQFLFGFTSDVTSFTSVHLEAGIGSPYFLEAGFNFRFGKKLIIHVEKDKKISS